MKNDSQPKILVVDDDAEIRDLVRTYLSDEGYLVTEARDGAEMRAEIADRCPDLILLDLKLPDGDGLSLARDVRKDDTEIGIVMISGKEDVVDRVAGLEVGADDYLVKPFHLRELLARVRSVLRRGAGSNGQGGASADKGSDRSNASQPAGTLYRFAGWVLDDGRRTLRRDDGSDVVLTGGEFDLLKAFTTHPNRALSRDQLMDYAHGGDAEAFDRSIDVQVGRLRRKIETDPKRPALIKTIRNIGYMLNSDVDVLTDSA